MRLTLNERQLCDLELLLCGGFTPLTTYLTKEESQSVCSSMRLSDGSIWPIPITLDVSEEIAQALDTDSTLLLCDPFGVALAELSVHECWKAEREAEAQQIFGTTSLEHKGVHAFLGMMQPYSVAGTLKKISDPVHYDFLDLRLTPEQLREHFSRNGYKNVIGFQTRNPLHRAHVALLERSREQIDGHLLIHPTVGITQVGDIDPYVRVQCYRALLEELDPKDVTLSLLPLAMRMAGPKEAMLHAIIRKNYGCTHFIVGRDHAGPSRSQSGEAFYDPNEASALTKQYEEEIGITIVPSAEIVYDGKTSTYIERSEITDATEVKSISGSEVRNRLKNKESIPEWFSFPRVLQNLEDYYDQKQGACLFLTGLPCAGKSTLARALAARIQEETSRPVTLLDGDIVRTMLSYGLGFSKEDRARNIERIAYVASLIVKHGGIVICSAIAPYEQIRTKLRSQVEHEGAFHLIYVKTPLDVCEARDVKGMYKKAREGVIKNFTGISDPYEEPSDADIIVDTSEGTVLEKASEVMEQLQDSF